MVKPVKDEIYGTRKSMIKPLLDYLVLENLFLISCLQRINPNPDRRYLMVQECRNEAEYCSGELKALLPFLRPELPVGKIWFREDQIHLRGVRSQQNRVFYQHGELSEFLLGLIHCPGAPQPGGAGKVESEAVSPFSRFLRTSMQARAGSTDIDFVILSPRQERLVLLEEKCYLNDDGGSLGHGQYLSLRELVCDVLNREQQTHIMVYLVFVDPAAADICYVYDFWQEAGRSARKPAYRDKRRNENRVLFPFQELTRLNLAEFLGSQLFHS